MCHAMLTSSHGVFLPWSHILIMINTFHKHMCYVISNTMSQLTDIMYDIRVICFEIYIILQPEAIRDIQYYMTMILHNIKFNIMHDIKNRHHSYLKKTQDQDLQFQQDGLSSNISSIHTISQNSKVIKVINNNQETCWLDYTQ